MRKSIKFLALSLASVSVMSLATPALAESVSANNETAAITTEEGASEKNDAAADGTGSAASDKDSSNGAQAADTENDKNQGAANPDAASDPENKESESEKTGNKDGENSKKTEDNTDEPETLEVDPAETVCTPYFNEKHEKVYEGKYATAYVTHDGYSGYIDITDPRIWGTADGLTEIGGYALSDIIHFRYGGSVSNIKIATDGGIIYNNRISVTGASGGNTASMYFTDMTNDEYKLTITSTTMNTHTVDYNSVSPQLKKIDWCTKEDKYAGENPETRSYDLDATKDWDIPAKGDFYQMKDGWKIYKDEHATAIVPPTPIISTMENFHAETGRIFITDPDFWNHGKLTEINGIPLSQITGTKDGYMSSVDTTRDGGIIYDNTLIIKGVHNGGACSENNVYEVTCIDKTKDYYRLQIVAGEEKEHTVWYNSKSPEIEEIDWRIYTVLQK